MIPAERQQITTTSVAGLNRLGTAGQRSYELVSRWVMQRLTPAHAIIFADPVASDSSDQVDWYTDAPGTIVPLAALSQVDQARARDRLSALTDEIAAKIRDLSASPDANTQRLAEALSNALQIPDESAVFVVRNGDDLQPVIVDWASVRGDHGGISDRLLRGLTAGRPPAPPPAAVQPPPGTLRGGAVAAGGAHALPSADGATWTGWLAPVLWLIIALLTALILFLVIAPCGLRGPGFLNFCPVPTAGTDPLEDLTRDRSVLENRLAFLERELASSQSACRPPPVAPLQPEQRTDIAPDDELQQRLDRENAGTGEVDMGLIWNSRADLDLHVTCPGGDTINYANRTSQICGGTLDVDMNAGRDRRGDPVEHVYFETPAPGRYGIRVVFFDARSLGGSHPFTLRISFGDDVEEFSGTLDPANPEWSTTYEYAP